ncbi:MAG: hypothetical protein ACK4F6_19365, partial [Hylemonella sp.]
MSWSDDVPATFEREHGCTETEWRRWLPGAVGDHGWRHVGDHGAEIEIDAGRLRLSWAVLPPRRIALLAMPRLAVRYRFDGVGASA